MGVSKVILNDQTLIDVTQKTVAADNLLSPNTALSAAGSDVVGEIATKSEADLVVDGAVVTVPSGYYATAASASTNAGATYTCTIIESYSTDNNNSVEYNNTYYKTTGDTFTYHAGDIAILNLESNDYVDVAIDNHIYGAQYGMAYEYTLPNHNIEVTILPDFWYSSMVVEFPTVTITENGVHTVDSYYYADVSVYPSLQSKSNIIPIESSQTIAADSSYYGLSSVQINAISSNYVGSNIPSRTAANLSASGSVVTAPSGYYATDVSKAISGGMATTPTTTISVTPTISLNSSTGVISVSAASNSSITPTVSAGYISSGTAGTVSVSGSKTLSLPTKAVASYTPSTSTQTIPSGVYLTGAQTIAGDSNLISENIAAGTSIFGVVGTYYGGATYTCTIIESNSSYNVASIEYNGTYYLTQGDTFTYHAGESAQLRASGRVSNAYIYVDNILVAEATSAANYVYTLPSHDIEIILYVGSYGSTKVNFPTVTITENGVHTVDSYYYADVSVYPTLQSKTGVVPSAASQVITADSGYYGLSSVEIEPIPISVDNHRLILPEGLISV